VQRARERATFREVFAVSEYRALWLAQVFSVAGDQLARVALTVLVYDRTQSALLAAITYAASIIPAFLGGILLSGLADRFPRRTVMIVCDVARALLVALMAIPGIPIAAIIGLLFVTTLASAPFNSARSAIYPDFLSGDRYVLGTAITLTTYQFAQVLGFVTGGAVVGFFGIRNSLLIDAATFLCSALLVRLGVRARPAPGGPATRRASPLSDAIAGARLVFGNAALLMPMLFGWLSAFYNVPEGLAAPFAKTLHGGPATVGLILGAQAFGASAGLVTFSRLVDPSRRQRLMGPLAIGASGILVAMAFRPGLAGSLLILTVSGLCASFQLAANAAFVSAAPQQQRSQAFGLAVAGMSLGQGAAMILAGAAAGYIAPAVVIALSGAVGAVAAICLIASWSRRAR